MQTWTDDGPEVPLEGGDVTEGLVRVGDTVRRPVGAHSPLVRELLKHLEAVGFDGAPRFLGIDRAGRDVLTFVTGEVAGRPRPEWIADEDRLVSVAELVRRYDDAVADVVVPAGLVAPPLEPPGAPPAVDEPHELIAHLDITPENVVFRAGRATALIDFDLARPASRVQEVINLMLWWTPFGPDADLDPALRGLDRARRCNLIADTYGLTAAERSRLMDVAIRHNRRAWHLMKYSADTIGGGWRRMWTEGVGDTILRRQPWLDENSSLLG
jgi:hypothetical protein